MENNTNTVNNKQKYIIGGVVAVVLIVVIALIAIFVGKNEGPVVDSSGEVYEPHMVSPHLYAASLLEGDAGIVEKSGYLYDLYSENEITKTYSSYIGREFLNSLSVSDINGKEVKIEAGNKKILIFTEGSKEYYEDYEGYLYLGALAKDVGAYDLYVINTNNNTMGDFSDNFNAHLLNKPTPEVVEFFETYPSDFILFISEENIIECISGLINVNEVSRGGGYVFSTRYKSQEYIRLFEEYEKDPAAATQKYYDRTMYKEVESVEYSSIVEANNTYNTNFYDVMNGKVLNEDMILNESKAIVVDGMYVTVDFKNDKGRFFSIQQGIGFDSLTLSQSNFDYYSTITMDDLTTVYLYGKSQEEIKNFLFAKNNVKVHICSDEGWTKEEVKLIVDNF